MDQWEKTLAIQPEDLGVLPWTHAAEGKEPTSSHFLTPQAFCGTNHTSHPHTHTSHTHKHHVDFFLENFNGQAGASFTISSKDWSLSYDASFLRLLFVAVATAAVVKLDLPFSQEQAVAWRGMASKSWGTLSLPYPSMTTYYPVGLLHSAGRLSACRAPAILCVSRGAKSGCVKRI